MTTNLGGRPPVGPRITLRFPTDLLAAIDRHAEATGTTRSDLLRRGAERILKEDTMHEYGTLTDYTTGVSIRPATADEHARSLAAGETGAYEHPEHGTVYVAGGPEGTMEP